MLNHLALVVGYAVLIAWVVLLSLAGLFVLVDLWSERRGQRQPERPHYVGLDRAAKHARREWLS